MELLDRLPKPFDLPMPYYVANQHSLDSLHCTTRNRPDGGITCEVLIPDGQCALDWVIRVNGACGPEFPILEKAIALLWSDAWRELSDKVRQRLNVWCGFEPMESFRLYLSDAEFGKHDYGLAGIVLTDRRLIYCKFHHRGQIPLEQEGILRAQPEGELANLTWQKPDGHTTKVAKLNLSDLAPLIKAMRDSTGLKLQLVNTA